MAALTDTNVLIYAVDARDVRKQAIANALLRDGVRSRSLKVPHQAVIEFVAATTRGRHGAPPLLGPPAARRGAEELLRLFEVLYPNEAVVRLALQGAAAYQLSWFDAHLWAYAEHFGLDTLYSEDLQHGRVYGSVRVLDPFV